MFLFFFLCFLCKINAQQFSLSEITKAYKTRLESSPKEYSFIHTDRDIYNPGQECWFKVYLLNNDRDGIALSKVVYFMLCDESGKILEKQILKVNGKSTSSIISLPKDLKNGQYFLAATTMWMQNDKDNFFVKKIYITEASPKEKKIINKPDIAVGFFPESGNIVADFEQKIGVRSIDQEGKSIPVNIVIKNSKQEIIQSFSTDVNGLFSISFKAKDGETYNADCIDNARGIKKNIKLPLVEKNKFALTVNNQAEKKIFVGLGLPNDEILQKSNYYLLGNINGSVVFAETFKPSEDLKFVSLNKQNLPRGILQFILVNQTGKIIAERLVWVNTKDSLTNLSANIIGENKVRTNSEIVIDFNTQLKADLSLSIARLSLCDTTQLNINDFALLMPLLNAQLDYHPYQLKKIITNNTDADNLMLTNGWRKVNDVDLMKLEELIYSVEAGLFIAGTIKNSHSNWQS
jgi:hypothetical protein